MEGVFRAKFALRRFKPIDEGPDVHDAKLPLTDGLYRAIAERQLA